MSLKAQAKNAFDNFDSTSTGDFVNIIEQIKDTLSSPLTREYLADKIDSIKNADSEDQKKKLCKKLTPYLDWYVQGN